jgi:phage replication O-like protein O
MAENAHFTMVPNGILEKLISSKLSGTQYAIVFALIRKTYGFHKDSEILGINFFVAATKRNRDHIAAELKKLIQRRLIIVETKHSHNKSRELGLNDDIKIWLSK